MMILFICFNYKQKKVSLNKKQTKKTINLMNDDPLMNMMCDIVLIDVDYFMLATHFMYIYGLKK